MVDEKLADRASELIELGSRVLRTARANPDPRSHVNRSSAESSHTYVDSGAWSEWRVKCIAFLELALGNTGPYVRHFDQYTDSPQVGSIKLGIGVLSAVRDDIAGGHLTRLRELVHADVFSDFIEMSDHLLTNGYIHPAAGLAGGVLEEQLRLLCIKNDVQIEDRSVPKKADAMNADLARAGVIDKNQQKIVTGWLGIRNSAAHGKFNDYTADQVSQFLAGLREFIARFPA